MESDLIGSSTVKTTEPFAGTSLGNERGRWQNTATLLLVTVAVIPTEIRLTGLRYSSKLVLEFYLFLNCRRPLWQRKFKRRSEKSSFCFHQESWPVHWTIGIHFRQSWTNLTLTTAKILQALGASLERVFLEENFTGLLQTREIKRGKQVELETICLSQPSA